MAKAKITDDKNYQGPSSREYVIVANIEKKDTFSKILYLDFPSCKSVSVTIQLINAGVTAGTVTGGQTNIPRGKIFPMTTAVSLLLANNDTVGYFPADSPLTGRYFVLDLSSITWGVTGSMKIVVTGKNH